MGSRDTTRTAILSAAESLFLSRGMAGVCMADIAGMASCTRRNLYRYFPAKDALVLEVVIRLLEDWNRTQDALMDTGTATGHQALGTFLRGMASCLDDRRAFLRLMGEFDTLYTDSLPEHPDPGMGTRFLDTARHTEMLLAGILERGMADGSLRKDLQPGILIPTLTTVLWGSAQRVALRDILIRRETGLGGAELLQHQIDIYLEALAP